MPMASLRKRDRADGTTAWAVLYTAAGQQTSTTFDTEADAAEFRQAVNTIGAERAMKGWGIALTKQAAKKSSGLTVAEWIDKHIDARSGVAKSTLYDYRSYLRNDIAPALGAIPLELLARDDIAAWVDDLFEGGSSGKTIANKHGFLSAALNAAVRAELIPSNPALGVRLPRTERPEMVFLNHAEFSQLLEGFTNHWRPLVEFMVASGARFGEVSALRPSDVNAERGTVHIGRAFKRTYESGETKYEIGAPKTKRSVRTINVSRAILEGLDYDNEWLFTNTKGGPLKGVGWRTNVWYPSVTRARAGGLSKQPRIHDMRHTCASWMIAEGVPLPVVQRHLGHESISTTVNLYGHLDTKDAEAAADVIGRRLGR